MKKILSVLLATVMVLSLAACGASAPAETQAATQAATEAKLDYPKKNISVIVPFGAGGNTDMSIRALLNSMTENTKDKDYTFVVDNKTGNAGLVGMEALAGSTPDGYTLGATCIDLMLHICFGRTEMTMDDIIPIACTMADPYGLVVSASNPNYSTIEEFVEYAKANPGKVKIGDSGAGAAPNVAAIAFQKYFGVEFDMYSYDGSADCVTAIETGEIDGTFTQPTPAVPSMKAGTLKMLAVLGTGRLSSFPDVPTLKETFGDEYDLVLMGWVALTAPKGTPQEIVDALAADAGAALGTDGYKEQINSLGMEHIVLYGDDLTKFLDSSMKMFQEICKDINLDE